MKDFYKNKKILITGHTGFKGAWLSYILFLFGAKVTGIALEPNTDPNLFSILNLIDKIDSRYIDIRNLNLVKEVFDEVQPEIVLHLAAQPLVIDSYNKPVYTYEVNVMGTVNICECVRMSNSVKSFINITTDKVYHNKDWLYGYRETDELNGFDPYSNSKSCSELVTSSYIKSYFSNMDIAVSTCRAGNVIGGGDFSENRILPDCVKYTINKEIIKIRNPNSIRPYQHVLEADVFYLLLAKLQFENHQLQGSYNIGPQEQGCVTTGKVVSIFCKYWNNSRWQAINVEGPHEANFLRLDISKAHYILNWYPIWNVETAIKKTVEWSLAYYKNEDIEKVTKTQIESYFNDMRGRL